MSNGLILPKASGVWGGAAYPSGQDKIVVGGVWKSAYRVQQAVGGAWKHVRYYPVSAPTDTPPTPSATSITSPPWRIRVTVSSHSQYGNDVRLYRNSNNDWIGQVRLPVGGTIADFDFDSSWNGVQVYAKTAYITDSPYVGPFSAASNVVTITDIN